MQIVLPRGETAFVHVFKAQPAMEKGKEDQFSATFLWDENDSKLAKLKKAIEDVAIAKFGKDAPKKLANGQLRSPIRPGSDKEGTNAEDDFAGKVFLTARSTDKPEVVDADCEPVMSQSEVYSGCIARADVWLFAYDAKGNRGVSCILNSFQKLDEGDRKSGRRPASAAFGVDEDDDEAIDALS